MKKISIVILLCFLFFANSRAQSDTAFWFAAPDVDAVNHPLYGQYDRPIYLRLTTSSSPANITVSLPANTSFIPINLSIAANSTSTIDLSLLIDQIENFEPSVIKNKGIYIQSSAAITAYYEVNSTTCQCNPELFSLKGRNALGNEFFVPSQLTWSIDSVRFPNAKAAFDIVATQNNTSITITPSKILNGHPANTSFTIVLNRGQSYSCQALYRSGPSLLNGSIIVSDKPIAVTTKEDLLFTDGACADLAGDQLIPTSVFGNEYAIIRGDLTVRDKVVITAKQNNTQVYLNGSAVSAATINAGQSHEIDITTQSSLYITTNNAVSVFHYTGNGCEVGAAVIPKLNCTGSSAVSIVRSNSGNAVVLLVTKAVNQAGFLVNGAAGIITAANFSPLPGTGGNYVFAKINLNAVMTLNTATTFSNTVGKFQLGFINGDPGGYMYGYFSDFKKSNVSANQVEVCKTDSVQLNANGGVSYQWSPSAGLNNPNISNPKASPSATTNYKVVITDIDGCIDSAFVKVVVNTCTLACNNWLNTPSQPSYVNIGKLDVTGNAITVEASFNSTLNNNGFGDLVSKHSGSSDCNYLLRAYSGEITTTNGYYKALTFCPVLPNNIYHVAMVYNGASLKFYRDGYLLSEVPATGNLLVNNWQTWIGYFEPQTASENFIGYINEVRIWNVARTQTEIRAYMNNSLPSPTTQPGLLAYYTFDNLLNKQGNTTYNGTLNGTATINATNPNCTFVIDSCGVAAPVCGNNFDFSYQQDVCNPLSVQFFGGGTALVNPYWSFGDAGTITGSTTPTHTYAAQGNYTVRFTVNNPACNDTITKVISINTTLADIIITPDTTICFGSTKQLRAQNSPSFCWSPTTYLNNPASSTPITSTPKNITYYYTSLVTGNNLITNGDFSQGNTGFTSQYIYNNASGFNPGVYNIGNNLPAWHPAMPNCSDHTGASGNGNMMMVNGDVNPNTNVWATVVTVTPNTNYNFSAWIQNVTTINPAQLQFSINGILVGTPITANINTCIWDHFFANWNSGSTTSATIAIANMNTVFSGNDFALDDISFAPVSIKRDSVVITVDTPHITTNSVAPVCAGTPVQLTASGASSYSWTPATGLSNPNIANPVATPASTTTYTVTGTTINGCSAQSPVTVTILPASNFDFSYTQDVCNPLSIQFSTAGTVPVNPYWTYGDGNITLGNANPVHVYPAYGNYTVKYHIDNATCPDTVTKIISIQLSNADIIITPDTTICFGSTKQLRAQSSPSFCWSPTTYLNDPASSTPITSTPGNITYYYTSLVTGNNLIVNGDFSQGNTGFSSQYNYANPNTTEGEYFVGTNPSAWNGGLSPCTDHTGTTGNGNMMLVNGAPVANVKVWSQTVSVLPNTNYSFSSWIQALYPPNPALLRFSINGIDVGNPITASLPTCTWKQFYTTWNSGNTTTAVISIVNQNTLVQGNDFALDDISFAPVTIKRDSVKIIVDTPNITATGTTTVCPGTPAQLNATGAATYSWTPATGLSNAAIPNPVATPATSTAYTVTGTTIHGCVAQATPVNISILPKPVITKIKDSTICSGNPVQLFATGGNIYSWTPATTLSNPNIANPVATPTASVTKYYVTVTNSAVNNCTNKDSVTITLRPAPVFSVSAPAATCEGTAFQLSAVGGDKFLWAPAALVSNPAIANPVTNTNSTTNYSVTITESTCNISTTLSTIITVNPAPVVNAVKSNDIDCTNSSAILLASGAASYTWSPAAGLNSTTIANPVAKPVVSTQYIVKGDNVFGCSSYDTLDVAVTTNGKSGYYMPNSFTPNGDGINDCFGIKYWGAVLEFQFIIYNRYGEKVFGTTDPNQCWNGLYKTKKPEPGNYVYYIKAKTACGDVEKKGNVILIR